jgi:hypothetical protein
MNRGQANRILPLVLIFSVAMGYLESAVVVYIRELYYPDGFSFPLRLMSGRVVVTELFRELATLVMLLGIGFMAGRSRLQRFGAFVFSFGIWDIFYYVFLKMILDWPESMLTWDILFMLPTTWTGPVLAPAINALTMVVFGAGIFIFESRPGHPGISGREWWLIAAGSAIVLSAYMQDYIRFVHAELNWHEAFFPSDFDRLIQVSTHYIPGWFNWWLWGAGQLLLAVAVASYLIRQGRKI